MEPGKAIVKHVGKGIKKIHNHIKEGIKKAKEASRRRKEKRKSFFKNLFRRRKRRMLMSNKSLNKNYNTLSPNQGRKLSLRFDKIVEGSIIKKILDFLNPFQNHKHFKKFKELLNKLKVIY